MGDEVSQLVIDHDRERYMEILEDYQRVVEQFLNIAHVAEGGFDEWDDYNEDSEKRVSPMIHVGEDDTPPH